MQSVPRTERNVSRHSRMTAPNTQTRIGHCAAVTASLVAAITPTLPVASLNETSGLPWSGLEPLDRGDDRARSSPPCGRAVNSITGITLQSAFSRPRRRRHVGHRLREHRLVARQHAPLRAALVPAGVQRLRDARQVDRRLDARQVRHVPGEVVDRRHHARGRRTPRGFVSAITFRMSTPIENFDVTTRGVAVVARVGAQLRHAAVEVADLHLSALPPAEARRAASGHGDDDGRRAARRPTCARSAPERLQCGARGGCEAVAVAGAKRTYESDTGSSTRLVRMMTATPRLAAIAISWMTRIWMNRMVTKPTTSVASAVLPARAAGGS